MNTRLIAIVSSVRPWNPPPKDQRKCSCMSYDQGTGNDPIVADVDLTDFTRFQNCFNGPNRPPACP